MLDSLICLRFRSVRCVGHGQSGGTTLNQDLKPEGHRQQELAKDLMWKPKMQI